MKIAILIGVDQYNNLNSLPGCKNDISAIHKIISKSNEFEIIKLWPGEVTSTKFKDELTSFFDENQKQEVSQLFFYFTGHGSYHEGDFYYLLSDYDERMRRKTSIQNSEIDTLIRSLNPELVVKVIDACQSGISYIKSEENIVRKYYEATSQSFKNCYFLHSSMTDQYSYQDKQISYFTKSLLKSLKRDTSKGIRYKDIIDQISDDFELMPQQTPFFVTQGKHTEVFLSPSEEILKIVEAFIRENTSQKEAATTLAAEQPLSLLEVIKRDALKYASSKELEELLIEVKGKLDAITLKDTLADLFEVKSIGSGNLYDLPNKLAIGKWLQDNKIDEFAKPTFDTQSYEEQIPRYSMSLTDMLTRPRTVTKYRDVLDGYQLTAEAKYSAFLVKFIPNLENLQHYELLLPFIFSKKEIRFFHGFTHYDDISWNDRQINTDFSWNSTVFLIKSSPEILDFIEYLHNDFQEFILQQVRKRFPDK